MPPYVKPITFVVCLIPLMLMVVDGLTDALGANPIEKLTHRTGDWTLRFLLITLSITPMRILTGSKSLLRLRRMFGLFCFFYAFIHFSIYLVFDQFFSIPEIIDDIIKRPYITVGFAAFVMLIPLAVTSTNNMRKRLGDKWNKLHQLVYFIAVCGILHYLWQAKADLLPPLLHAFILIILFAFRSWHTRIAMRNSSQSA